MSGFIGSEPEVPPIDYAAGAIPGTTQAADPLAVGVAGSAGQALGTGTGQHGITPLLGGSAVGNAFASVWAWLNKPFTTPMNKVDVFLLIGTIIVAVLLWNIILYHVRIAAETI
jgi:hypothetical protein